MLATIRALVARLFRAPPAEREAPYARGEALFRRAVVAPDAGAQRTVAVTRLSATGARIEFFAREILPAEFTLIEPIRGLRRRARVVWQEDHVAGLAFIDG